MVSSDKTLAGKRSKTALDRKAAELTRAGAKLSRKLEANFAEAGYEKSRKENTAPYAIKKQRAERDAQRAKPKPRTSGKTAGLKVLMAGTLENIPWLVHGFSTQWAVQAKPMADAR